MWLQDTEALPANPTLNTLPAALHTAASAAEEASSLPAGNIDVSFWFALLYFGLV
jgi:hypothetical protein